MDVRCEKCRTEYELDETKLKPGGVTVKCTSCGHMFKVRRRITAVGPAVVGPPTLRSTVSEVPPPIEDESEGRTWLVRLQDGEILTCRELSTLQKWIVAGRVTRVCQISRSGKKWKPLGEIGELASFFQIADEARDGKGPAPARTLMGHPNVVARPPTSQGAPAAPLPEEAPAPMPAQPSSFSQPPPRPPTASPSPVHSQPAPPPLVSPPPSPARRGSVAPSRGGERATGEWASRAAPKMAPAGPSGFGGPVRGQPRASSQAEFAGLSARIGDIKGEFEDGAFVPSDEIDAMRGGGAGKWIALVSILVILGGLVVLYWVVIRPGAAPEETAGDQVVADAAVVVAKTIDAAPEAPPVDESEIDAALRGGREAIEGDTAAGLELAFAAIEKLGAEAQDELPILAAKARIKAALGQHTLDEVDGLERPSAKKVKTAEARKLGAAAEALGRKVFDADSSNLAGIIALADAIRVQNRGSDEVDRYLRKARTIDPNNRDADMSQALLFLRDDNARQALRLLEDLDKGAAPTDVRAAYRLARIHIAERDYYEAKASVDKVLAAQPEHAGAAALAKFLATVEIEEPTAPSGDGDGDPSTEVDSYDRLVSKADSAAESGNCTKAIDLYERALGDKPSGVAALTGLGYCYLDSGRYSSAHTKFTAALAVSSRYQDAMWGMAELYERQGNKPRAAKLYQQFVAAHPGSGRAVTARKKIEQLGGVAPGDDDDDDDDDDDGGGTGSGTGSSSGSGAGGESGAGGAGGGSGAPNPAPSPGSGRDSTGNDRETP